MKNIKFRILTLSFIALFACICSFSSLAATYNNGSNGTITMSNIEAFHGGRQSGEYSITSNGGSRSNRYNNRVYWYEGYTVDILQLASNSYAPQYNGKTYAYCIAMWEKYGSNSRVFYTDYTGKGNIANSNYWKSLGANKQRLLALASMYGFPARTPEQLGVSSVDDAYAATQCIMWEIVTGRRNEQGLLDPDSYSSDWREVNYGLQAAKDNSYFFYQKFMHYAYRGNGHTVGENTPALTAYWNIENAIRKHDTIASFANQTHTMNWNPNSGLYECTLNDSNGVFADSYLPSQPDGILYYHDGNTLTVKSKKPLPQTTLTFSRNFADYSTFPIAVLEVSSGSGQAMLCGYAYDPRNYSVSFKTSGGMLNINQASDDKVVSNVKYHVTGNGVDQYLYTDSTGWINTPLNAGEYTVTECDVPSRYATPPIHKVTITDGQESTVWAYNHFKRKDLIIRRSTEDGIISGVQYRVTGNGVNTTVTTNQDGIAIATQLPLGTYTVTPINTPARYVASSSKTVYLTAGTSNIEDGGIYYIRNKKSDKVIDVSGSNTANGTKIEQYELAGTPNQMWKVHYLGRGVYSLESMNGGYMTVMNNSPNAGEYCKLWKATVQSGQRFMLNQNDDGSFSIQTQSSNNQCVLDVWHALNSNSADIVQQTDNGANSQKWYFVPAYSETIENDGIYYITAKSSLRCFDVENSDSSDGIDISQFEEHDKANQHWQIHAEGNGDYTIKNLLTGKLLCVLHSSPDLCAKIQQWHDTGESGQRFKLRRNANGTYSLLTKCSGYKYGLDIGGNSMKNGGKIQQWNDFQWDNQSFYLRRADESVYFHDSLIRARVKMVKQCTFYYGYVSGAEYRIYKANGTYTGQSILSDASEWKYSELLVYGDYYLQEVNPPKYYALDKTKHSFSITQNGVNVPVTVQNTPTCDVYPVIIPPNADYHAGTEIIVSYHIYNDSIAEWRPMNKDSASNPLTVTFTASANGQQITKQKKEVVVPRFADNLVYFKVKLPQGITNVTFSCSVESPSGVVETNTSNNVDNHSYSVLPVTKSETPNTKFEETPSTFTKPSESAAIPTNGRIITPSASWDVWAFENNSFVLKEYGVTLNAAPHISADDNALSSYCGEGVVHMRSGYGFSFETTSQYLKFHDCLFPELSAIVLPQNGNAYFPEFNYSSDIGKFRTLELTAPSTYINRFEFEKNPHSMKKDGKPDNRRIHFSPLWFPDGNYTLKTYLYDSWTPAGMINTANTVDPVEISGNMYEDWVINHTDQNEY